MESSKRLDPRGTRRFVFLLGLAAACAHPPADNPPGDGLERLPDLASLTRATSPQKPMLVHFWALWCPACMDELPAQVALARRIPRSKDNVLFIDMDGFEKAAEVQAHLSQLGALGLVRNAQLNMDIEAGAVTPLFSPKWAGELPATFVRGPGGATPVAVFGPASAGDQKKLLDAVGVKSEPERVRPPPPHQPGAKP